MYKELNEIREEFTKYNGFYKNSDARQIIYELFRGRCAASGEEIDLATADIGHIVPQSESTYFENLFPGLDVHNLINLHLLDAGINRRASNNFPKSPLFLHNAISFNIGLIRKRLPKIQSSGLKLVNTFDPELEIRKLSLSVDVDLSAAYEQVECYGSYHRLNAEIVDEALNAAIHDLNASIDDFIVPSAYQIFSNASMLLDVKSRNIMSISSKFSKADSEDANNWYKKFFEKFSYTRRESETVDLPDGKSLLVFGPAKGAPHQTSCSIKRWSHDPVVVALQVLAADDQEKHIVGKFDGKHLLFIPDARAIHKMYMGQTPDHFLSGLASEKAKLAERIWFCEHGGSEYKYSKFAEKTWLKTQIANSTDGCLILSKDYGYFLRRLRTAVQKDLKEIHSPPQTLSGESQFLMPALV